VKRFWKEVEVAEDAEGGWAIQLDGRSVKTPAREALRAPTKALADAIAEEWNSVESEIDPRAMPLTGLANAAIDRIAPDPATFAQEILRRDIEKYRASASLAGPVFFDRTAVEAIAMLHEAAAIDGAERDRLLSTYRFHAPVFVLPPWREIYVMDAERDQPFDGADAIHLLTLDCYGRAGYAVALVPLASPQERARFVLRALALD